MRQLAAVAIGLVVTMVVLIAPAQEERSAVLHEDLTSPKANGGGARTTAGGYLLGNEPRPGDNPAGFARGEKVLPAPAATQEAKPSEIIYGADFRADRHTEWQPDRGTGPDGTLSYTEVFNPSLVPFKRMTAMDAIRDDYTLYTERSARTDLPVGGRPTADRETFWGSVVVELDTGVDIAIPSVAPSMRILSYEVTPHTSIVFSKDRADNFYVRSDEAGIKGRYRLTFLADAPSTYFAPRAIKGTRIADLPMERATKLPAPLRSSAARAANKLGISREMDLHEALDRMTFYFRGFEAKQRPPATNDIFWDLFESKAGVCRHRSFAFVVVAAYLGIPARYVTNEAHAWVEVWDPAQQWMRIDLGGAALTLEVSNAEGKTMHRPRGEDPFNKPPEYLNNYSQLVGDIDGLTADQVAEARAPIGSDGDGLVGGDDPSNNGDGDGSTGDGDGRRLSPGPGRNLPELPESSIEGKAPTFVRVFSASSQGYRGESISVRGAIVDERGVGIGGLGADVYIAPAGSFGEDAVWIGQTVTDAAGRFETALSLPAEMVLGSYELFVGTPGNSTHRPAVSE